MHFPVSADESTTKAADMENPVRFVSAYRFISPSEMEEESESAHEEKGNAGFHYEDRSV